MNRCKQCDIALPIVEGKCAKVYCSDKCRMSYNRSQPRTEPTPNTEQTNPEPIARDTLIEQCVTRAAQGKSYRKGDPLHPYTRHLNPSQFIAWCRLHRPSWLTIAKPGDADYNWEESAVPMDHPARAIA